MNHIVNSGRWLATVAGLALLGGAGLAPFGSGAAPAPATNAIKEKIDGEYSMRELLKFTIAFPPNYIALGDLTGNGKGGLLAIALVDDAIAAYDNAGRQIWVHRNDPDFDATGGWPCNKFNAEGQLIPWTSYNSEGNGWINFTRGTGAVERWKYDPKSPHLAKHPWGGSIWANAHILPKPLAGKVLCWRYRLRLLDGASGKVLKERQFDLPGTNRPDPIGCAEVGQIGGQPVFFVSTLHAGLFCVNSNFDILWRNPDLPPVAHRGFVGDVDGDGDDEFFGGTTGILSPKIEWGWGPEAWCALVDHDGKMKWRKEIGPGKAVDIHDNHLDWVSIRPDRIILSDGLIFDQAGKLAYNLRQHINGHLQTCFATPGPDYRIYFTSREPSKVAQFDANGRLCWVFDKFKTKRLHEGAGLDYFGKGRQEYVVEEMPNAAEGETGGSTYVLGRDGQMLDKINHPGMARNVDWNGDGREAVVLQAGLEVYVFGCQPP